MSYVKKLLTDHLQSPDHLSKKHIHPRLSKMFDLAGLNVAFVKARGNLLFDSIGRSYLDLLSGGGVHYIGRQHPEVVAAIRDVNEADLPNLCVVNASLLGGILAGQLLEMAGSGFSKVQYSNSGAEANEVAIRFARFCTRKRRFLHLQGAFHGRTYGAISLCGFHQMNEGMDPKMPTCTMITPNDISELRAELSKGDVAGVFYEYCQGMTLTVLDAAYLHEMRKLCSEYGAMMIADEVQTGFGRVGEEWFGFQKAGILPDMVTLSKALSGGAAPVAATLIGERVYEQVFANFKSGPVYFSTFAENNIAMAAGLATLKVLRDLDGRRQAQLISEKLRGGLQQIAQRYDVIERIAGEGLMIGIYFRPSESRSLLGLQQRLLKTADKGVFGAAVNVELMASHRMITQIPGPEIDAIKLLPPVTLEDSQITQFLEAFDATMATMYRTGGPALPLGKAAVRDAFRVVKGRLRGDGEALEKKTRPRREGQLLEHADYDGDLELECDVVVVGSGPGGTLAAVELAKAGKRVILIEAGPKVRQGDTRRDAGLVLSRYFFYGGMRNTQGNLIMPNMQARNLGGGSVWNSAICMRMPKFALEKWESEHGLRLSDGQLDRHFLAVETFLGVRPTAAAVMGPRNDLFAQACEKIGAAAVPTARNEKGCRGSAECFTYCPSGAKQSVDRRGVPELLELGGVVLTSVAIELVVTKGRKAIGVRGVVINPTTKKKSYRINVKAPITVMAAGCLATPEILLKSELGNKRVGENLRFHPGSMVMGQFDHEIEPWSGATQGVHCLDYLKQGIKLEALWATSGLMAGRFPGLGQPLQSLLKNYRTMCAWDSWVSGEDSVGSVRVKRGQRADLIYNVGQKDCDRMAESMALLCEMFFSVGATKVMTGVVGLPSPSSDRSIIDTLRRRKFGPTELALASNHIFGTTAMGVDPKRHAVSPTGALYDADNLYVCDTGLLPATPGANPMLPTMALVHQISEHIAQQV